MDSKHSSLDERKVEFLRKEYEFLYDYMKYKYDERDRYIKFYIGALTAIGTIIGIAIKGSNWSVVFILAFLTLIFSCFMLRKVVSQRAVVTEYKNHLNLVRGELLKFLGGDEKIESIILSTAYVPFYKKSGGDASIIQIIVGILAISAGGAVWVLLSEILPSLIQPICIWQVIISIGVIVVVFFIFQKKWKRILEKAGEKFKKKIGSSSQE